MKEIARHTGLSIPTVHQVLNGYKVRFSDETRRKVLDAAKALDYRPNIAARGLRARKTYLLGLLFNSVNSTLVSHFTHGFQGACTAQSYAPILLSHLSVEEESQNTNALLDRRIDGLVANCAVDETGPANASRFAELRAGGLPIVEVFGRFIEGVPRVTLDYAAGAAACTRELIARGHRDIHLLIHEGYRQSEKVPGLQWTALEYWRGYQEAMQAAGLAGVVQTYPSPASRAANDHHVAAYEAVERIMQSEPRPTAFVCYLGEVAEAVAYFGATHPTSASPRLAVAAFAEVRPAPKSPVDVVSLKPPTVEAGRAAAQMVLDLIAGREVGDRAMGPKA